MRSRIFQVVSGLATLAIVGVTVILVLDGRTFLLQRADPSGGHLVKGCYTLLDDLLRTAQPSGVLRLLELLLPIVLLPGLFALRRIVRRRTDD
jgi:hypothetical protein